MSKSYGNLSMASAPHQRDENKENNYRGMESAHSVDNLLAGSVGASGGGNGNISVRERTRTFNRMASQTEMLAGASGSLAGSTTKLNAIVKRRNSRAVEFGARRGSTFGRDDDSHDSASITTLDPTIKSWMIQISKGRFYVLHEFHNCAIIKI